MFSKLKGPFCLQVLEKPPTEATFNTFTCAILHYGFAFIVRTKYFHYLLHEIIKEAKLLVSDGNGNQCLPAQFLLHFTSQT